MSKKTRKKTLKKTSKPAARKPASAGSKASAKKPAAKKSRSTAAKPTLAKPSLAKSSRAKPAVAKAGKRRVSASAKTPIAKSKTALKSNTALTSNTAFKSAVKPETKTTKTAAAPSDSHAALAEGAKAPSFRLPRDGGEMISLTDFAGQKLVLFFYPRADTPGCTKEAIDFTRLVKSFAESKTAVVGVSADPLKAQESFRNKHQLATPLASDEKHEMLTAYGVWGEKSMYGKTFLGVLRTTVLIGADGRVVKIWRHVKVDGHADEVLETVRAS